MTYSFAMIPGNRYSALGLSSISMFIAMTLFVVVYVDFAIYTTRKAYLAEQTKEKLKTLQSAVLKEQIAPHFLFNSLQSVKTNYRLSQDKGDRAIDLLSRHMRNYVQAGDQYLIPFVKELDAVMTFVELSNLRTDRPFHIIYDIDEEDFLVPPLSIEPLIENAVLYSGVNEKEDGYIEISSSRSKEGIMIRISDNGKGFDMKSVRKEAVGIKNAFERFRLLLGAKCAIKSEPGQGTIIEIETSNRGGN